MIALRGSGLRYISMNSSALKIIITYPITFYNPVARP